MKPKRIAILLALACIAYAMSGCASPNGTGTPTVDPAITAAATQIAVEAIHAYAGRDVRAEK